MIVRILSEGQFTLDENHFHELNALDSQVQDAVTSGDQAELTQALGALLDAVRSLGTPLPDDQLADSELILPPADATVDDVRQLLSDDGLIPG